MKNKKAGMLLIVSAILTMSACGHGASKDNYKFNQLPGNGASTANNTTQPVSPTTSKSSVPTGKNSTAKITKTPTKNTSKVNPTTSSTVNNLTDPNPGSGATAAPGIPGNLNGLVLPSTGDNSGPENPNNPFQGGSGPGAEGTSTPNPK